MKNIGTKMNLFSLASLLGAMGLSTSSHAFEHPTCKIFYTRSDVTTNAAMAPVWKILSEKGFTVQSKAQGGFASFKDLSLHFDASGGKRLSGWPQFGCTLNVDVTHTISVLQADEATRQFITYSTAHVNTRFEQSAPCLYTQEEVDEYAKEIGDPIMYRNFIEAAGALESCTQTPKARRSR